MKIYKLFLAICCTTLLFGCNSKSTTATDTHGAEEAHEEHSAEEGDVATLSPKQLKAIGLETGVLRYQDLAATLQISGVLEVSNVNKATISPLYGGTIQRILIRQGAYVRAGQTVATIINPEFIRLQDEYINVKNQLAAGGTDAVTLIANPQFAQIQAEYSALPPQIELAETEVLRQKMLNEGNAGARRTLQEAESNLATLLAKKQSLDRQLGLFNKNTNTGLNSKKTILENQLKLMGINPNQVRANNLQSVIAVKSPMSGVVQQILTQIGAYVDATNPVAYISNTGQLHADLKIFEKDISKVTVGQIVNFKVTNNPQITYSAQIYSIDKSFQPESKTVTAHASIIDDKAGLIEGMNISGLLDLGIRPVPTVPSEAIVSHQGQDYIFIQEEHAEEEAHAAEEEHAHEEEAHAKEEEEAHAHEEEAHAKEEEEAHAHEEEGTSFKKIAVRKGISANGFTEITLFEEIPKNAKIVFKGAFFVLAKLTNQGEGHAH